MEPYDFQGFSQQTIDFMWGLRMNNNREWFEAHRDEYREYLCRPMEMLCAQLWAMMEGRDGMQAKVCRIYRDARRLHGKGPYKDHLWLSIGRRAEDFAAEPVFWFELAPEHWNYGLGYYSARAATMARLRARIDRDPAPMLALLRRLEGQEEFVLEGQDYARAKHCAAPELARWYNKRSFSLIHRQQPLDEAIFRPELAQRLAAGFQFLMPFYGYFSTLDSDGGIGGSGGSGIDGGGSDFDSGSTGAVPPAGREGEA